MKKKIVLWGEDENNKKILVALELLAKENKVNIYTFDEQLATESFYNSLMDDWRIGKEIEFPEGFKLIESPLSMTDDLLPENIKVQRSDVITRAKAEWHFVVLSSKLYDLYHSELEDFKERISKLTSFESGIFEELKGFWSKVADQARERNIFRDHADRLKNQTNELFNRLKELRSKANAEMAKVSKETMKGFNEKLDELNVKVEKGLGLNPIFEELKKMQADFKKATLSRDDRNKLWKKIDTAFKNLKEKKYGKREGDQNRDSRLGRRYDGLMSAIEKMERSISRDKKDIDYQNKRVGETHGQLEMQIRQAKVMMIQERINSKQEKLNEMLATKVDLEKRIEKEEAKKAKAAEKKKIDKKKEELKEKIAGEISQQTEEMKEEAEKLAKAADAINKKPKEKETPKKESMLGAISTVAGEALENVVDTVKAVSEVVGDKMGEKVDEIKDKLEVDEKVESLKEAVSELKEDISEKVDDIKSSMTEKKADGEEGLMDKIANVGKKIADEVKEVASDVKEEIKEKVDDVKASMTDKEESGTEAGKEEKSFLGKIADVGSKVMDEVSEVAGDLKEKAEEVIQDAKDAMSDSEEE